MADGSGRKDDELMSAAGARRDPGAARSGGRSEIAHRIVGDPRPSASTSRPWWRRDRRERCGDAIGAKDADGLATGDGPAGMRQAPAATGRWPRPAQPTWARHQRRPGDGPMPPVGYGPEKPSRPGRSRGGHPRRRGQRRPCSATWTSRPNRSTATMADPTGAAVRDRPFLELADPYRHLVRPVHLGRWPGRARRTSCCATATALNPFAHTRSQNWPIFAPWSDH